MRKRELNCKSIVIALVCWLACGAALWAAEQTALTTAGPLPGSKVVSIKPDFGLVLAIGGKQQEVAGKELVVWGQLREADRGPWILLADGSWLVAEVLHLTSEECRVDSRLLGELSLPRGVVRGVIWRLPADRPARDRLLDRGLTRSEPHDLLVLANGDELSGKAQSLQFDKDKSEELLRFEPTGAKEPALLPVEKLSALFFDAVLLENTAPRGAHAYLGLRDGSRLLITAVAEKANRTEFTLANGTKLRMLNADLADDITLWQPLGQPGVVYLSDVRSAGYKHIPFLTLAWPYHADRNDQHGRLRQQGVLYAKGLGMHSTSRLAYDLPEDYRRFEAELALDDAAGNQGSVLFRVFTAGETGGWKAAYESPVVRGGDVPRAMQVDLQGVKRLALIVDFAERGDEQDHANWLNARLIK